MSQLRFVALVGISIAILSCSGPSVSADDGATDGDAADSGGDVSDSGDVSGRDAGEPDAGEDAGVFDAGDADAGDSWRDAGEPDAGDDEGVFDAGGLDAGFIDAGDVDAGETDAGRTDAGEVDAGTDAGVPDAGVNRCQQLLGAEYEPFETRCDGIDNDCNGIVDVSAPVLIQAHATDGKTIALADGQILAAGPNFLVRVKSDLNPAQSYAAPWGNSQVALFWASTGLTAFAYKWPNSPMNEAMFALGADGDPSLPDGGANPTWSRTFNRGYIYEPVLSLPDGRLAAIWHASTIPFLAETGLSLFDPATGSVIDVTRDAGFGAPTGLGLTANNELLAMIAHPGDGGYEEGWIEQYDSSLNLVDSTAPKFAYWWLGFTAKILPAPRPSIAAQARMIQAAYSPAGNIHGALRLDPGDAGYVETWLSTNVYWVDALGTDAGTMFTWVESRPDGGAGSPVVQREGGPAIELVDTTKLIPKTQPHPSLTDLADGGFLATFGGIIPAIGDGGLIGVRFCAPPAQ